MKKFTSHLALIILMLSVVVPIHAEEIVYNNYNLHVYEHTDRNGTVYKANYSGFIAPPAIANHFVIPPGTAFAVGKWRQGFTLTRLEDGMLIHYEFSRRHMKMQVRAYIDLVTSAEAQSLPGLTKIDHKGIKLGKALVGMTRNGVLTALGYPAKHKTPSLEAEFWTYWKDRWRTLGVQFNRNGKVARVVE